MEVISGCWIFWLYIISYFFQVVLPSQCTSYTTNNDYTRNVAYIYSSCCPCENIYTAGWYRFEGLAGTRLSTFPSNTNTCNAYYPGWFNGSLPTTVGASTNGNMCFNVNGNICNTFAATNNIMVTNCGDYYVFLLSAFTNCNYRYCTTWIKFNNYRKKLHAFILLTRIYRIERLFLFVNNTNPHKYHYIIHFIEYIMKYNLFFFCLH